MAKNKSESPKPAAKPTVAKKCARRRNGVPGANTKQRRPRTDPIGDSRSNRTNITPPQSTASRLLSRPLYESGRVHRLCRKLGINLMGASGIKS